MLKYGLLMTMLVLVGCNSAPSTAVRQPMTVRPTEPVAINQGSGSIYQVANSRPLFEDRRARFVGDTLTIVINERTSATKSTNESTDRSGSAGISVGTPTILGLTPKRLPVRPPGFTRADNLDTSFSADSSLDSENSESSSNSNNFSGSITVTVIEVLPNGNLMVSGEKQIAINQRTEYIRLSGVVNPINISAGNSVSSTQLADARVESKGKQDMDTAQVVSMLSRFFIALLPF